MHKTKRCTLFAIFSAIGDCVGVYLCYSTCLSISVAVIQVWNEFFIRIIWWWLPSDEKQFPLRKCPSLLMLSKSKYDIQGIHVSLWATDNVI